MTMPEASPTEPHQLERDRLPQHHDRLYRAACVLCGNQADAEDLVQEVYVRVLRRPRLLRRDGELAYLLKVLKNTWINDRPTHTRRAGELPFDEQIDFVVDAGADPAVRVGEVQAVYAAVAGLSEPLREALLAVDVLGLSYKQASWALAVPQGTIMSRLHRGRSQVAKQLRAGEEISG